MIKRTNKPTRRLYMYSVGQVVKLKDYAKHFVVAKIREDGYYDLANEKGRIVITASSGHEVKE